ncbi:NYN domain-containing protein [Aquibium oceanicum]|uniref:HTH OST-type domain-containing protein n=1 Tax=Aquibium oceanicum TaxID=1670800 RepID=A0A1L3SVE3_9HYPH|nr:NYN domain-containing protein [Aquibium oceanicum]APH73396.1 hypothetical protein BSQ44_19970 [Aquibium oceanicum]
MTNLIPQRLALLIDIDNGRAGTIDGVLAELERYGRCDLRLGFGDFERTSAAWREACVRCAIEPRHYPALPMGAKNAADIAIVITAMDLLHGGSVDGFAIVSSDTDFVRLAARVREAGLPIYGFGPWKTSERFRKACTRFFFVENLVPAATEYSSSAAHPPLLDVRSASDEIRRAITRLHPGVGGWIAVDDLERELIRQAPDFDPRSYGKPMLLELLKAQKRLNLSQHPVGHWRVRIATKRRTVGDDVAHNAG